MFGGIFWVGALAAAGYVAWRWRQRQSKDATPPTYIEPAPIVTPAPIPEIPATPVPPPPTPELSVAPDGPRRIQTRIHRGPPPSTVLRSEAPVAENVAPTAAPVSSEAPVAEVVSLINLNSADEAALISLPGIGSALARRIIVYRQEHGPFRSVEQLDDVQGISLRNIEEFRHLVTI